MHAVSPYSAVPLGWMLGMETVNSDNETPLIAQGMYFPRLKIVYKHAYLGFGFTYFFGVHPFVKAPEEPCFPIHSRWSMQGTPSIQLAVGALYDELQELTVVGCPPHR